MVSTWRERWKLAVVGRTFMRTMSLSKVHDVPEAMCLKELIPSGNEAAHEGVVERD